MPPRAVHPEASGSSVARRHQQEDRRAAGRSRAEVRSEVTPPPATATRIAACSNHSSAKSETGIGSQRRRLYASFRPSVSKAAAGFQEADQIRGGLARRSTEPVRRSAFARTTFTALTLATNSRISIRVWRRDCRETRRARAWSRQIVSARPSVDGTHPSASPAAISAARAARARARARGAASMAAQCDSVGHLKPGTISDVIAHPPTCSAPSRTSGLRPAFARSVAVNKTVYARANHGRCRP